LLVMPALLISILLPSLNRAREQANRIKCASNMRQIGQAIQIYANENKGQMPPDLDTLVANADVTSEIFVCPASQDERAPTGGKLTTGHLSYVYVYTPGTQWQVNTDRVVLYEPMTNHGKEGTNILYADGHVDWIPRTQAERMLNAVQSGQNPPPP
jgi:prepilin-type processing-associated H-X9-DG protein